MAFFYHSYFFPFFLLIFRGITRVFALLRYGFHASKHILADNTFVVFIFENLSAAFSYFVFFILFSSFDSFYFCDIFSMAVL